MINAPMRWELLTVGDRLRVLRKFAGHETGESFAQYIGAEGETYRTAERTGNLSRRLHDQIRLAFPQIGVGWLWYGDLGHTPDETIKGLYGAARALGLFSAATRRRP